MGAIRADRAVISAGDVFALVYDEPVAELLPRQQLPIQQLADNVVLKPTAEQRQVPHSSRQERGHLCLLYTSPSPRDRS